MKKEHLKKIQIVCRNKNDVKKCIKILEQIGLEQVNNIEIDDENLIVAIERDNNINTASTLIKDYTVYFFNKTLIKMLNNIIKKEKLEDFEVASDGRIIKINNWNSEKEVFCINGFSANSFFYNTEYGRIFIELGLLFATEEARDRAKFKMEIEIKLKNIAERLNNKEKIDWDNEYQNKYYIGYYFRDCLLSYNSNRMLKQQGCIYCLSNNFLDEAIKEIGKDNLIKYFKGE